jgi:hypothetical protein
MKEYPSPFPFGFKGDGEKGFTSAEQLINHLYPDNNISFFFRKPSSQGYQITNSYSLMDSVIRTIRNLVGKVSQYNPKAFANHQIMASVIDTYNNTVHSAFKSKYTPYELQTNPELEDLYIEASKIKLNVIDELRLYDGLLTYEPGAILLIHIPIEKTQYAMRKRRRNFDELGRFVEYRDGNAVIDLLNPYPKLKRVIIPVYYTKYLAKDIDELKLKYSNQFLINT